MKANNGKRIVIFAKTFLPNYTPESIRTASLIKYFLRDGWEIFLFTYTQGEIFGSNYEYLKTIRTIRINKIINIHIPIISKLVNYIYQLFIAFIKINNSVKEYKITLMFVSIPQLQPLLIGAAVKIFNKRIKLTEEIRDIYSFSELTTSSKIKRFILTKVEGFCIKYIDHFIFVTPVIKSSYETKFGKKNRNIKNGEIIYNGFDEEDLPKFNGKKFEGERNTITFLYTGKLYGSRNADEFLNALGKLINEHNNYRNIKFQIVGEISNNNLKKLNEIISEYDIKDNIFFLGILPHIDCMKLQQEADYNVLITHKSGSFYAVPSKIFEYAASGKTIIAVTEDKLVREIIESYRLGFCVSHRADDIYLLIKNILKSIIPVIDKVSLPEMFTRKYQFDKIKEVLHNN